MNLSACKHSWLYISCIGITCLILAMFSAQPAFSAPMAVLTPEHEPLPSATTSSNNRGQAAPPAALTPSAEPATPLPPTSTPEPEPTPEPQPEATATPEPEIEATSEPNRPSERADPRIHKTVDRSDVQIGDVINFTLLVSNSGGETAKNVIVQDAMPSFLDILSADTSKGSISISERSLLVHIDTVAPGERVTITIQARVNESATVGEGSNRANLTADNRSDNPNNNTSVVTIRIAGAQPTPTLEFLTPTPEQLTPTPEPEVQVTPSSPAASPAAPAVPPARMPHTGADTNWVTWLLTTLGLLLIGFSIYLRRLKA